MPRFPEDPINSYPMGQRITLGVDLTNVAGATADPDTITLFYIEGDGTAVTVVQGSLDNPSVGRWEFSFTLPKNGDKALRPWVYRFESVSANPLGVNASDENRFELESSPFYPPT